MSVQHLSLTAMALDVPDVPGHPNRMPFSGVLTRVDSPSDRAPHGSPGGRRVMLTRAAAEAALPSLLGMPVNFAVGLKAHAVQAVVATIREATISGDALEIRGDVFAKNFPVEAKAIRDTHATLGFSYELDVVAVESMAGDPLVITECVFTGAAILLRDDGAYLRTSLAAAAAQKGRTTMDDEALTAAISAAVAKAVEPIATDLAALKANPVHLAAANMMPKVEPHAARLEASADKMEADGMGGHSTMGHAKMLRDMAASMRADAAKGVMPSMYHNSMYAAAAPAASVAPAGPTDAEKALADEIGSLKTVVADLKAAAAAGVTPPERKTVAPGAATSPKAVSVDANVLRLLASKSIDVPTGGDGEMSLSAVDKALEGLPIRDRAGIKASLMASGIRLT